MTVTNGLKVVALISGGKDSIFSILHCQAQGHDVVALANLHPPSSQFDVKQEPGPSIPTQGKYVSVDGRNHDPDNDRLITTPCDEDAHEIDLDSYMYQTVGYTIVPLFESILGLSLYRREIQGTARNASREYTPASGDAMKLDADLDETEDLIPLLREVMLAHPEVNAVSTGAILSNYQRTRVESVALRLGLTPLSYLWQYPYLPPYQDLSLLRDMQSVNLDARIIKVASGGLDERMLWLPISQKQGWMKIKNAMRRFASSGIPDANIRLEVGAVLGEGGEFETLVVNGPAPLFKGAIVATDQVKSRGEGGSASVILKNASVVLDGHESSHSIIDLRIPPLFDIEFEQVLEGTERSQNDKPHGIEAPLSKPIASPTSCNNQPFTRTEQYLGSILVLANLTSTTHADVGIQLHDILESLAEYLDSHNLLGASRTAKPPLLPIIHSTLLLREMGDFVLVNHTYAEHFAFTLPPSRVTVACGDALPPGVNVMLSVVIDLQSVPRLQQDRNLSLPPKRNGLHVQSRSYWAPANIGPYSQARAISVGRFTRNISERLASLDPVPHGQNAADADAEEDRERLRLVYIAGQIPLVPSTMQLASSVDLPHDEDVGAKSPGSIDCHTDSSFQIQAVLALQHLCRVARATSVRFFTPTIAMLSRSRSYVEGQGKARLAGSVWRSMHKNALQRNKEKLNARGGPHATDGDSEDEEVDLWDLRNRMNQHTLESDHDRIDDDDTRAGLEVPDYSLLTGSSTEEERNGIPPMFSVEVRQLPRDAAIEWCSTGIATPEGVKKSRYEETISSFHGTAQYRLCVPIDVGARGEHGWFKGDQTNESASKVVFTTNTLALNPALDQRDDFFARLSRYLQDDDQTTLEGFLTLYVSSQRQLTEAESTVIGQCRAQFMPCFNIWDESGTGLACLAVEQVVERS